MERFSGRKDCKSIRKMENKIQLANHGSCTKSWNLVTEEKRNIAHLVADFCLDLLQGPVRKDASTGLQVTEPENVNIGVYDIKKSPAQS